MPESVKTTAAPLAGHVKFVMSAMFRPKLAVEPTVTWDGKFGSCVLVRPIVGELTSATGALVPVAARMVNVVPLPASRGCVAPGPAGLVTPATATLKPVKKCVVATWVTTASTAAVPGWPLVPPAPVTRLILAVVVGVAVHAPGE